MKHYNSYQKAHYTNMYGGHSSQNKPRKYSLMEAGKPVLSNVDYACVAEKNQKMLRGCKSSSLVIQPFINKAKS